MLNERWTAAKFVQGQLRIVIDNSYAELEVTNPDATSISHDDFVKMIRPAIGHMPSADSRAILKHRVFFSCLLPPSLARYQASHANEMGPQGYLGG